jgi:hypothetical protein
MTLVKGARARRARSPRDRGDHLVFVVYYAAA